MKIAHVTILNPIDHTRILKIVKSQIELGHSVTVVGKSSHKPFFTHPNLHFFITGKIRRDFWYRIYTHLKIFFWWIKNVFSTDFFWIHTPELFWMFFFNFLLRKRQVYDVHENYFENIVSAEYYSSCFRKPLAYIVRAIERMIAKTSYVVYAEYSYINILKSCDYEVISNAFDLDWIPENVTALPQNPIKLVISGNLSEEWGVMNAIDFWEKQNEYYPAYLTIIGYSSLPEFSQKIRLRVAHSPYKSHCQLVGIEEYVSYVEILKAIAESHIVLAPYQIHPKFFYKIPTKFYEAMAMKKTILFSDIPYWKELNKKYSFGFCIKDWKAYWELQYADYQNIDKNIYDWKCQIPKIQRILKNEK